VFRRFITKVSWTVAVLVIASGCRNQPKRAPAIAEAYVGPAQLKIRSDIPLDSATVATAKHGERLDIIQRRRKFLRVRTVSGAEGWTDERQLLGENDMAELRDLATRAAKLPSQGVATTYRDVNMHTQPVAGSPSFLRIKEGEKFDVLAQLITPRTDIPRQPLIPPAAKKKAVAKKPKKEPKIPPPPMPVPPPLPSNWLDLSKTELDVDPAEAPEEKPIPTDYWSLVRMPSGQSGWVLTRLISMAIPDEVAQYAEGHRIVSYLPLGYVQDEDQKKPIWLWATVRGRQPFDFDSFRVFVWNLKRHRYETAFIGRNVEGHLPVLLNSVEYAAAKNAAAKYPGFSVCLEKEDGQRVRREFALLGNVVRYAGERPCEVSAPMYVAKAVGTTVVAAAESPVAVKESLLQKVKGWFKKKRPQ
jgi:uncharacterized protein YgiM (DUF1202 family)